MSRPAISIPDENERGDKSSGAGAAPGRQQKQPRAEFWRGEREGRSAGFYASLGQMHSARTSHRASATDPGSALPWTHAHVTALGGFLAEERWIVSPHPHSVPLDDYLPTTSRGDPAHGDDDPEDDRSLGLLLAVIADDVHQFASAARDGINADFAARAAYARRTLPRGQVAATLSGLAQARKAALAVVSKNAASEIASRKRAAIEARRRRTRAGGRFARSETTLQT
jgi:hypothetical protein